MLSSSVRGLKGIESPEAAARVPEGFGPAFRPTTGIWSAVPDKSASRTSAASAEPEEMSDFRIGQRVKHPALGEGRIESFVSCGTAGRAVIQFDEGAKLKPLGK